MPNSGSYTVRSGDTLSKIAASAGVDMGELARLNRIADPNSIRVGQVLALPGGEPAATPAPAPAAAPTRGESGHELGSLSERFESGGRGPGTVSGGAGDFGGVSYGSYQLASKLKRPEQFLATEGARWAGEFGGAKSGTPAFSATWKAIAAREGPAFHAAQHAYIKRTHYDVQCAHVRAKTGVDLDSRCDAVRDAVWSTAVQQGPSSDAIVRAMAAGSADDRALLTAIYAERGRKKPDGSMAYFGKCSPAVQAGVANRYRDELKAALKMLGAG